MRTKRRQGTYRSQRRRQTAGGAHNSQGVIRNRLDRAILHLDFSDSGTIGPRLGESDGETCVRHTEADIVAEAKASAVGVKVGICHIEVPGAVKDDLLDIAKV